jgi:hypothetical protein
VVATFTLEIDRKVGVVGVLRAIDGTQYEVIYRRPNLAEQVEALRNALQ